MWPKSVDIGMEVSHENGLLQGELRICLCLCFLRKPLVDFVRSLLVCSRVEQAQFYILFNKPLANKLLVIHHSVVTEHEQSPMDGGVTAGGQKTAAGQPRARTTVRAMGSKTCWEVVALAAWMLRCFVTVEMRSL